MEINTVPKEQVSSFAYLLELWYRSNLRKLPWRDTQDAYLIWLSEVILQQTRVAQGLPYFQRFKEVFPTVRHLAEASEEEVLRLWQGLGYYSRARNMHACAKRVIERHGGVFPTAHNALIQLPGIGKYTAAAVASFAGNERKAVVDGNVYRVLSRYLGLEADISKSGAYEQFESAFLSLTPEHKNAVLNQAVMELGATICLPRKPRCTLCPIADTCHAWSTKKMEFFPVKSKKIKKEEVFMHYLVVQCKKTLLMKKRPIGDIWAGMYDFLQVDHSHALGAQEIQKRLTDGDHVTFLSEFKHELTHKRLRIYVFKTEVDIKKYNNPLSLPPESKFFKWEEIDALPKPVVVIKILELLDITL